MECQTGSVHTFKKLEHINRYESGGIEQVQHQEEKRGYAIC
jgi:hypothetical protein